MRKTLLTTLALLFGLTLCAQNFHLEDANDSSVIYSSGDTVEVTELGDLITEAGFFNFKIRNNSEENIKVQAKLIEEINGNTEALQFCFAVDCYVGIVLDRVYPTDGEYAEITPGGTHKNDATDHIANFYDPENQEIVSYTFRFFEINDNLEEIGEPFLITYQYNPTLSTPYFETDIATLSSTILKNIMDIQLNEDAYLRMYDSSGRKVFDKNLTSGTHQVHLPNLLSNLYFVQLINKTGARQTFKVIVK